MTDNEHIKGKQLKGNKIMATVIATETFPVFSASLPYIINGDGSGLDNDEETEIDLFLSRLATDYPEHTHLVFSCDGDDGESFENCCITNQLAGTLLLTVDYMKS